MFQCTVCSSTFRFNKNLYQHMRRKHNIEPALSGGKITCPLLCVDKFRTHKDLRSHLESFHGHAIEKEEQDFPDIEAFEIWKRRLEMTSGYAYARRISEKTLSTGEAKSHFICNRSGVFRSESTGQKSLKKGGSNKIGTTCPSVMEVSRSLSDGKIHVEFWKTHIGHEADIQRSLVRKKSRTKKSDAITFEVCAVLPAAGVGERMGLDTPKQYIPIHGKPIICYTVEAFLRMPFIKKVVVVAASQNLDLMLQTLSEMCALRDDKLMVTEGSGSRHQSINSGLKALQTCCETQPEVVIIHDGVRPFFSEEIVYSIALAAKEHGAAGVVCPLVSTVISADENGFLDSSLDRTKYKASEMPQGFHFDVICKAYAECSAHDLEHGTECLHLVQKYCSINAKLLPGSTNLWKITHPKDIYTAAACVKESQTVAIVSSVSTNIVPSLQASLCKKFNSVCVLEKMTDSSACRFPNVVQVWSNKSILDIIDQIVLLYGAHKSTELLSVVYIILDNTDEALEYLRIQKQAKNLANDLRPFKFLFYLILLQTHDTIEYAEVAELATSLLFDSNPNISGSIFIH